ncbi:hypothetical protein ACIQZO_19695 [Streptomyces sp. NPDC097617]|uniref:hypothetical protein n=1 Tax=Streptomyces sp. NPDC097617 TaxID=3366091 RepID=UPI00382F3BAE
MKAPVSRRGVVVRQINAQTAGAKALRERRTAQLAVLTQGVEEQLYVDVYVLVVPGRDAGPRTKCATTAAQNRGWAITRTLTDTTGPGTDLALRPALALALDRITRGESTGIVAVSQTDFSSFADDYEALLDKLGRAGGFLDLAHAETAI